MPPPFSPAASPTGSSLTGDPHLHFAHGGEADFRGEDGGLYAMLHHHDLAVNDMFEACAFFLESPSFLKVRGTFVTDVFFKIATVASGSLLRVEFSPNAPPTPLIHGLNHSGIRRLVPGESLVAEDVSIAFAERGAAEVLYVRTAGWAVNATARFIRRSATTLKKQVDLSFLPLRDPLEQQQRTGKVVAPHGLIGQSFDGDNIAVDGNKDHYRELWWRQTSLKGREITTEAQAEGAIEGSGEDYRVADIFATDFKYRRFAVASAAPRNASALTGTKRTVAAPLDWSRSVAGALGGDIVTHW